MLFRSPATPKPTHVVGLRESIALDGETTLHVADVTLEEIAASPEDPQSYPAGSGISVTVVVMRGGQEQRATLINDVLWMEQNLSFQFERNNAQLTQLGPELLGANSRGAATEARIKRALDPESGMIRILWLGPDGKVKDAEPPYTDSHLVGEAAGSFPSDAAFRLSRSLGRPTYSDAYAVIGNQSHFEVHVPIFEGGHHLGTVVDRKSVV